MSILNVSLDQIVPHFKGLWFQNTMPKMRLLKVNLDRNGSPFKFSISFTFLLGIILRAIASNILNNP